MYETFVFESTLAVSRRRSASIHHPLTFSSAPRRLPGATGRVTNVVSAAPKAPDGRPVLFDSGVYRFLSLLPALIIHAAESHAHQR